MNKLTELSNNELSNINGDSWRQPIVWIHDAAKAGWEFGNWLGAKLYGNE